MLRVLKGHVAGRPEVNAITGPHAFKLFQQGHFGMSLFGDLLDPMIVLRNTLVQRFDFPQQRFQGIPQPLAQPMGAFWRQRGHNVGG